MDKLDPKLFGLLRLLVRYSPCLESQVEHHFTQPSLTVLAKQLDDLGYAVISWPMKRQSSKGEMQVAITQSGRLWYRYQSTYFPE